MYKDSHYRTIVPQATNNLCGVVVRSCRFNTRHSLALSNRISWASSTMTSLLACRRQGLARSFQSISNRTFAHDSQSRKPWKPTFASRNEKADGGQQTQRSWNPSVRRPTRQVGSSPRPGNQWQGRPPRVDQSRQHSRPPRFDDKQQYGGPRSGDRPFKRKGTDSKTPFSHKPAARAAPWASDIPRHVVPDHVDLDQILPPRPSPSRIIRSPKEHTPIQQMQAFMSRYQKDGKMDWSPKPTTEDQRLQAELIRRWKVSWCKSFHNSCARR